MNRRNLQIDPPYCEVFDGLLSFSSFAEAEVTINRLEKLYQQYMRASDKKGMEYCRQIASLGRRRAELISCNKRVSQHKRLHKKEIATWFQIWLETPGIFMNWLALRKNTEEFRKLLKLEEFSSSESGDRYGSGSKSI
jgi:hypothetical protein